MRKLYIFDTTLRDGEQSLGFTLKPEEKLEVAKALARLGVDIIEAGFPASSPGDFESVRLIGRQLRDVVVCGLTRAHRGDIDTCAEALKGAAHPRIHTGLATSPIHMERKLRKTPDQVVEMAVDAVRYAKKFVSDVEFYAEDAFRSDREFLRRIFSEVIKAGATVINVPDTVGYASPWEYGELISWLRENVEEMDRVIISVHCHNDLGMATANSLAGIRAGATQVEGTINGIGERAGNTALEEVIMAIYSHRGRYGVELGNVNIREIARTSQLVSMLTGVPVQPYKAIVGSNAFSHASGIHQDGVLKDRSTYEIIKPEDVGFASNRIVLTNRSGRHALKAKLAEMGYALSPEEIDSVYKKFLEVADAKSHVTDEDLAAIVQGKPVHVREERVKLKSLQASTGGVVSASAVVVLEIDGAAYEDGATGAGPVDAAFRAIRRLCGVDVELVDYSLRAITSGADALGEAVARLAPGGRNGSAAGAGDVVGRGVDRDVIKASALAFVDAVNKLLAAGRIDVAPPAAQAEAAGRGV